MKKSILKIASFLVLLPLAFSLSAQPEKYVEGTHYTRLSATVNTLHDDKIEVVEAFWYGCPHCFSFEPLLDNWAQNLADDVEFLHFPAMWNALMKIHAQVYYTAESLGKLDVLHEAIFNAINVENNRLQREKDIAELFAKFGVSENEFESAFNSFSVRTKVNQAEKRMSDYQIQSTPNMIVNGKYLVSTNQAVPSQAAMLEVVNFLVDKERNAKDS